MAQWEVLKTLIDSGESKAALTWLACNPELIQQQVTIERAQKLFRIKHVKLEEWDGGPWYDSCLRLIRVDPTWVWPEDLWEMVKARDDWDRDVNIRDSTLEGSPSGADILEQDELFVVDWYSSYHPDDETSCKVVVTAQLTWSYEWIAEFVIPETIPFPPSMAFAEIEAPIKALYAKYRDEIFAKAIELQKAKESVDETVE